MGNYVEGQGIACGPELQAAAQYYNGTIYASTISNSGAEFYRVNPITKAATKLPAANGLWVADMTDVGYLGYNMLGVFGPYVLPINVTTGAISTGYYWSTEEVGGNSLVAITYYGSTTANIQGLGVCGVDFFVMLDTEGNMYQMAFTAVNGGIYQLLSDESAFMGNIGYSTNDREHMNSLIWVRDENDDE